MKYNILFYMLASNNPQKGGIERVSLILAKRFIKDGCKVYSLTSTVEGDFGYTGSFTLPEPYKISTANTDFISHIIDEYNIDFLIATTIAHDTMYYNLEKLNTKAKIISHYHISPEGNHSRIHRLEKYVFSNYKWFRHLAFFVQRRRIRAKYNGICNISNKVVLLSKTFIPELNKMASFPSCKLCVIRNPLTYSNTTIDVTHKHKLILWVGRIDESEKRISSMLRIWKMASPRIPDWRLQILGGGEELEYWKNKSQEMKLVNCEFLGFQDPKPYYENASIYTLTSNTEGWPTTLVEAMCNGCVPIVFDSFASAEEMIKDEITGCLIKPFNDKAFADKLVELASNDEKRRSIAETAFQKTKSFDVDEIIDKWYDLFDSLSSNSSL